MSQPKRAKFQLHGKKGFQLQPKPVYVPKKVQPKPVINPDLPTVEKGNLTITEQILDTVEPYSPSLEELKLEAKALKIKGWNFYKDAEKLNAKIVEVRESTN